MMAEEKFLETKYDDHYRTWAAKTPAFLPRLSGLIAPALPFSWRSALLREFHTFFLITTAFAIVEMLEALLLENQTFMEWLVDEPIWPVLFVFSAVVYVTVRVIKKKTRWLKVKGR
jgi:hypothetical protein